MAMGVNTLVLAPFSADGLSALEQVGMVRYEPWTESRQLWSPQELGQRLDKEGFQALVVEADFLFEELFATASGLRYAAICRAALNQVDLAGATEQGVVVVHTPGRNAQAVAELVLGLMLSLARWLPAAHSYVTGLRWNSPTDAYTAFQGRELAGATLGIIGFGATGRRTARLAHGTGMRVLAHDPYVQIGTRGNPNVTLTGLESLLRKSDFVSLHVPETEETIGLLDARRLELMQPTAYLVNVASPAAVPQEALAAALREGRLAGAALDVHETHPIPPSNPFLGMPNVVLTPHIGGATMETITRHSAMVVSNLAQYLKGRRPLHLANPDVWARRRR